MDPPSAYPRDSPVIRLVFLAPGPKVNRIPGEPLGDLMQRGVVHDLCSILLLIT